ncbi:MAG: glycosyl hydrolase family 18 protein [Bacteroidota bacterium]
MKISNFLSYVCFILVLCTGMISYAQELPEPPKPPEVEVAPPEFVGKVFEAIGTGLGISKKSKRKREASRINEKIVHETELSYYTKNTTRFNTLDTTIYTADIDSLNFIVMGWSPFWTKDAYQYYSYELLSDISFFSYTLNPKTGSYTNIQDQRAPDLIDKAKTHGCNVYITISAYGKNNTTQFLRNESAQKASINALIYLVKSKKADGITLDMNPIAKNKSAEFTQYVNALATALHDAKLKLNLVLPPVYEEGTFDIPNLVPNVDLCIILGYGYAAVDRKIAGPLSPLVHDDSWRFYALNTTIDSYLEQGVPADKAIVSLSYLGTKWQVKKPEIPSVKSKHLQYFPFREASQFQEKYKFELEPLSYSMFTSFPDKRNTFSQLWMDNAQTLKAKYQLIIDKGLKGVAIWSLGYDNGFTEFWELLAEMFAAKKPKIIPKTIEEIQKEEIITATELLDSILETQRKIQDSTNAAIAEKIEDISEKVTTISDFTDAVANTDSLFLDVDELKKEVFGWHPHWAGERYKSYNFKLLTTLAYFSYEVNPKTGGYKTIHNWATTNIVDSAHAKGTKVHLTATNFGEANNREFLNNTTARQNFINEIITQIERRGADGINLDFENIPAVSKEQFTSFVIQLSERLQIEGLEFSMAIPSVDTEYVYDFKTLINFVDYFVMMGYNYHKQSPVAGPNSPLKSSAKWGKPSIEHSVNTYFSRGIPPIQLIVAYPYYGIEYSTESIQIPSETKKIIKEWSYSDIRQEFKKAPIIDLESASAYYVVPSPSNDDVTQLWFDNEESFAMKCDWINQKKLRGVGIWALGYDHGNNELWTVLNQKFAKDPNQTTLKTAGTGESLLFKIKHILNDLSLNSTTIIALIILLLAILFIGFCFAIINSQVVDILFNNRLYQAAFIILFLVLIVAILELKNLISSVEVLFFIGALLGIGITFFIRKRIVESNKNKP